MKRLLHHPFFWGVVVIGLILTWTFLPSTQAEKPPKKEIKKEQAKLPIIEARKHKNYVQKIPKSEAKFEMIAIPGGTYQMGSPKGEKGRQANEGPQRAVTVKPFWMGKCEVTWNEFDAYWKSGPPGQKDDDLKKKKPKNADAITRPTPPYADETFGHGRDGHPVLCITHHAAREYCRWLSKVTGHYYRLPTEAEWEWACRAGTTTTFSFGDDAKKIGDYAWNKMNADEITNKVGLKKPNPWGLHDMHGNVAEWCIDHYSAKRYETFSATKPTLQPVLLPTNKRFSHVVRGGSWDHDPEECRSAWRIGSNPKWIKLDPQVPQSIWWLTSAEFVGFRVVRAVKEQDNLKGLRSKVTRDSPDN